MTAECEHKVRGGSALSAALGKISPAGLVKSSPVESATSTDLSSQLGGGGGLSSIISPCGPLSASTGSGSLAGHLGHSISLPLPQTRKQQQQQHHHRRSRLPFLSCFGSGVFSDDSDEAIAAGVSASEVGIRPCFYWLESPISAEDRMFAEANARWLKSDCQDDAVVISHFGGLSHQTFAGVFDGHGPYGRNAAKFASTRLPQVLAAKTATAGSSERRRLRAMREACLEVNAAMKDMEEAGFDASLSGTTACCVLVVGRKVLVASTGDSRCVVARRAPGGEVEVVPLTWDAKPSLPEEQKRIAMSGGVVKQLLDESGERVGAYRVFSRTDDVLPGLAMSRSLGDLYAHEVGVTPEPVLNTYTLGERDLFLILATDGLWDIMANEEAADFVERYKARRDVHISCAEALTLEAQERWKARHEEAIVDDISCVILHTAVLPPPERDNSVPRPLARAAACNDEANELYLQWQIEQERNPSNHKPKQYFKHLYSDGEQPGTEQAAEPAVSEAAAPEMPAAAAPASTTAPAPGLAVPAAGEQHSGSLAERAAVVEDALTGSGAPPSSAALLPPPSPQAMQEAPHYSPLRVVSRATAAPPPRSASFARLQAPFGGSGKLGSGGGSSAGMHTLGGSGGGSGSGMHSLSLAMVSMGMGMGMDDVSSSPRSSFDLGSEHSDPSVRRGSSFAGAFHHGHGSSSEMVSSPVLMRHSGSQPIPMQRRDSDPASMSLPIESLLRPVRKAYPSTNNMGGLYNSYRSDASLMASDTPRSIDGLAAAAACGSSGDPAVMEHKVRGGMARSLSNARLPHSLPSHASLAASASRTSVDLYYSGSSRRGSHADERVLSTSSPGSPSGDSMLSAHVSSPQYSPVVVPLGGYSRVAAHPPLHGGSSSSMPGLAAAASAAVRADMVQRGSHLSRTTTDSAGLAQAMATMVAESGRARSCAASAAAAAAAAGAPPSPASRH